MTNDWWKKSVIYQVYPQSFKDSNGDGIGDLNGVSSKLEYLKKLGVDALWLTPIYKSPQVDNGYDIEDYYDIDSQYGTMDDFKNLLNKSHDMNLKIVMDLVVNHTSDKHKWFQESKKSKDNEFSDYYIWRDPKDDGSEPNNWGAAFGGSVWTYEPSRKQYYLHLFSPQQPDLNWENPKVRESIYIMMRFWLDMGVDGFRMDTISLLSKNMDFPDGFVPSGNKYASFYGGAANGPHIHDYLKEMNKEVLSHYDIMTVGETPHTTMEQAKLYTDPNRKELNMVFQFENMHVDYGMYGKWSTIKYKMSDLRESMAKWQISLTNKGWNSLFWSNHDQPRPISKFGNTGKYYLESAKALALLLHMQQGTPYIFQGEEIGMTNVPFKMEQYRDLDAINAFKDLQEKGVDPKLALKMVQMKSRDNGRTPIQWDTTKNAGFSDGKPWIDLNDNYKKINAKECLSDPNSIFFFYKKLISLRHSESIITDGIFKLESPEDSDVFSYTRTQDDKKLLIIVSLAEKPVRYEISKKLNEKIDKVLISTNKEAPLKNENMVYLKPYEGVVYEIANDKHE